MEWHNDKAMQRVFGVWWTQELDLRKDASMEQNVQDVNNELEARGFQVRMAACRDTGGELEWTLVSSEGGQLARARG